MALPYSSQTLITVINSSTAVTATDANSAVRAVNMVVQKFCQQWSLPNVSVQLSTGAVSTLPHAAAVPSNSYIIRILDVTDVSGIPAYHTLVSGVPSAKVFAKTILDAGGAVLYEPTRTKQTVAQCISREIFEMLLDPKCSTWTINPATATLYANEVCDPVNGSIVVLRLLPDNTRVSVSDWTLPAWRDVTNTVGPFNYLDTLTAPFQVDAAGYAMTTTGGVISYIYGANITDAAKAYLQLSLRTLMRTASLTPSA